MKSRAIPRAIALVLVIAAITGSIYFLLTRVLGDAGDEIVETVDKAATVAIDRTRDVKDLARETLSEIKDGLQINPKITIGSTVFVEGSREISEHAFSEKRFEHVYDWKHVFMGSEKKIKLKGTFIAKAGYSLDGTPDDPTNIFEINISEDGKRITAKLPPPEILSVEMIKSSFVVDEGGVWNKISKEDRNSAINSLIAGARKSIAKTDILEKADQNFYDQIQRAIRKHAGEDVTITRSPLP